MKNAQFNFRISITVFAVILILLSCSKDPIIETENIVVADMKTVQDSTIIEGHYIVLISKEPTRKNARAAAVLEELSKEVAQKSQGKINRTYKNVLTGFAAKLTDKQVQKMRKDPRIISVEPDGWIYPSDVVNVQEYCTWGLDRIDQAESLLDRTYAYTATGSGVTAYILDSGIRYSHNEFENRASLGFDFVLEENPENTDANQLPGEDCNGHGTHVAGTVGGNNWGVAKDIDLVSVRVFGCSGGSPRSRVIAAVDWITQDVQDNNRLPAVVNMSLGGGFDPDDMTYQTSIENSILAGINYVAAAGNATTDACEFVPARFSNVVTVSASQFGDEMAYFSNFGDCVDIYAPGENITSASIEDDSSFTSLSGTSMAAPHVAGVIALYLQNNSESTPAEVQRALIENSTPNVISNVPSGPNHFIYSQWETVDFVPPTPPDLNLSAVGEKIKGGSFVNLTWDPTDAPYIKIYQDGVAHYPKYFNTGEQQVSTRGRGKNATYVFKICELGYNNCSDDVTVVFGNGGGGGGETTNEPPTADFNHSAEFFEVRFTDNSSDNDGSIAAWSWNFGDGNTSTTQNPVHNYSEAGIYNVSLTVTDDLDDSDNILKNITINNDDPEPEPEGLLLSANGYKVKGRWNTDLSWEAPGAVDIYRDGKKIASSKNNTGTYTDATSNKGGGSLTYNLCLTSNTTDCSAEVIVQF